MKVKRSDLTTRGKREGQRGNILIVQVGRE
jgi:hypothetical protein